MDAATIPVTRVEEAQPQCTVDHNQTALAQGEGIEVTVAPASPTKKEASDLNASARRRGEDRHSGGDHENQNDPLTSGEFHGILGSGTTPSSGDR